MDRCAPKRTQPRAVCTGVALFLPKRVKCALQAEIDSIIWEADTDCDRCLTWKEFQEMYDRCRNDQTGAVSAPANRMHTER